MRVCAVAVTARGSANQDGWLSRQVQPPSLEPLLPDGRTSVVAPWHTSNMSNETRDGHPAVSANLGETHFRVRGNRMVDTNTGETSFRVRDDGRVMDANSGESPSRVRDDGRVVDADTGETVYRLRD